MPSEAGHYYIASRPLNELLMQLSEMMLDSTLADDVYNELVPFITKADNQYTDSIQRLQATIIEQGSEIQALRANAFVRGAYTPEEVNRRKSRADAAVECLRSHGDLDFLRDDEASAD